MGQMRTLLRQLRNAKPARAIGRKGEPFRRVTEQDSLDNRLMYLHATKGWRNRCAPADEYEAALFERFAGDKEALVRFWRTFKLMMQSGAVNRRYPTR